MPQPTFSTKKPPRLKRTKSVGGIIKNASNRKNAVVDDSVDTTCSKTLSETPKQVVETESVVAARVRQIESSISSNMLPDGHNEHKKGLVDSIKVLEKLVKELSAFSVNHISRSICRVPISWGQANDTSSTKDPALPSGR